MMSTTTSTTSNVIHTPIEYFDALFRGDRSRFELEVARFTGSGRLGEVMGDESEGLWLTS